MANTHRCMECDQCGPVEYNGKCTCEKWNIYVLPDEVRSSCSYFWPNGKDYEELKDFKKESDYIREPVHTGCYITTMLCEILGLDDKDERLVTLRSFRNNVMQKNKKYLKMLCEYDQVGPVIAEKLRADNVKKPGEETTRAYRICTNLDRMAITKVKEFVDNKKYDEAVELYKSMYDVLVEGYHIDKKVDPALANGVPTAKLGHGKVYQKVIKEG